MASSWTLIAVSGLRMCARLSQIWDESGVVRTTSYPICIVMIISFLYMELIPMEKVLDALKNLVERHFWCQLTKQITKKYEYLHSLSVN